MNGMIAIVSSVENEIEEIYSNVVNRIEILSLAHDGQVFSEDD